MIELKSIELLMGLMEELEQDQLSMLVLQCLDDCVGEKGKRCGDAAGNSQEVVVIQIAGRQGRVWSYRGLVACESVRREGVSGVAMDNQFMAGAWASRCLKRKPAGF